MGDAKCGPVRLSFNPQLRVEFRGATVTGVLVASQAAVNGLAEQVGQGELKVASGARRGSCARGWSVAFYKRSWLKQYNKGGRVLGTEVCINDPRDFSIGKSLVHLGYLGRIANHALTRFVKAQTVALATALDRSTFERLVTPSTNGGQRVAGLRFGAPRAMRLLEALGCAGLTFKAFSNADLRSVLVERLGADPGEVTPPGWLTSWPSSGARGWFGRSPDGISTP